MPRNLRREAAVVLEDLSDRENIAFCFDDGLARVAGLHLGKRRNLFPHLGRKFEQNPGAVLVGLLRPCTAVKGAACGSHGEIDIGAVRFEDLGHHLFGGRFVYGKLPAGGIAHHHSPSINCR